MVEMDHVRMFWQSTHVRFKISEVSLSGSTKKKGYNTARRATARKMLTVLWYMLTNKEPYRVSYKTYSESFGQP
jgi:hypothetical protein